MPNGYYQPRSFEQGDEFYMITYNSEGKAVNVDPVEYYDQAVHESDSSDSDAEKPCVTKARADGLRKRKAAQRVRRARREEVKRKRKAAAAEDLRLLKLHRLSLKTVELEKELPEQQQRRVVQGRIRREWERQRALEQAMWQRFHNLPLPATWDDPDSPAPMEVTSPAQEVGEADTPTNILEREDIGVLFEGREDIWVPNND
ncbi:hypothetical protein MMC29_003475 [Sticta canariensis]|nr:hypothetical protein [Sticta canariensis]